MSNGRRGPTGLIEPPYLSRQSPNLTPVDDEASEGSNPYANRQQTGVTGGLVPTVGPNVQTGSLPTWHQRVRYPARSFRPRLQSDVPFISAYEMNLHLLGQSDLGCGNAELSEDEAYTRPASPRCRRSRRDSVTACDAFVSSGEVAKAVDAHYVDFTAQIGNDLTDCLHYSDDEEYAGDSGVVGAVARSGCASTVTLTPFNHVSPGTSICCAGAVETALYSGSHPPPCFPYTTKKWCDVASRDQPQSGPFTRSAPVPDGTTTPSLSQDYSTLKPVVTVNSLSNHSGNDKRCTSNVSQGPGNDIMNAAAQASVVVGADLVLLSSTDRMTRKPSSRRATDFDTAAGLGCAFAPQLAGGGYSFDLGPVPSTIDTQTLFDPWLDFPLDDELFSTVLGQSSDVNKSAADLTVLCPTYSTVAAATVVENRPNSGSAFYSAVSSAQEDEGGSIGRSSVCHDHLHHTNAASMGEAATNISQFPEGSLPISHQRRRSGNSTASSIGGATNTSSTCGGCNSTHDGGGSVLSSFFETDPRIPVRDLQWSESTLSIATTSEAPSRTVSSRVTTQNPLPLPLPLGGPGAAAFRDHARRPYGPFSDFSFTRAPCCSSSPRSPRAISSDHVGAINLSGDGAADSGPSQHPGYCPEDVRASPTDQMDDHASVKSDGDNTKENLWLSKQKDLEGLRAGGWTLRNPAGDLHGSRPADINNGFTAAIAESLQDAASTGWRPESRVCAVAPDGSLNVSANLRTAPAPLQTSSGDVRGSDVQIGNATPTNSGQCGTGGGGSRRQSAGSWQFSLVSSSAGHRGRRQQPVTASGLPCRNGSNSQEGPVAADREATKIGKLLAYLLRHGALLKGIAMRSDAYVRVSDILEQPQCRKVLSLSSILDVVQNNNKRRYGLGLPAPLAARLRGEKQSMGAAIHEFELVDCPLTRPSPSSASISGANEGRSGLSTDASGIGPGWRRDSKTSDSALVRPGQKRPKLAVGIEGFSGSPTGSGKRLLLERAVECPDEIAPINVDELNSFLPMEPARRQRELDRLVPLLFVRACQGHSIKGLDPAKIYRKVERPEEVPLCLHGTYWRLWGSIMSSGLKRMARQYVHFARGFSGDPGVISGIRGNAEIVVQIDVRRAMEDGMEFWIAANGVVLSCGFNGVVPSRYFTQAFSLPDRTPVALVPTTARAIAHGIRISGNCTPAAGGNLTPPDPSPLAACARGEEAASRKGAHMTIDRLESLSLTEDNTPATTDRRHRQSDGRSHDSPGAPPLRAPFPHRSPLPEFPQVSTENSNPLLDENSPAVRPSLLDLTAGNPSTLAGCCTKEDSLAPAAKTPRASTGSERVVDPITDLTTGKMTAVIPTDTANESFTADSETWRHTDYIQQRQMSTRATLIPHLAVAGPSSNRSSWRRGDHPYWAVGATVSSPMGRPSISPAALPPKEDESESDAATK